MTIIPSTHLALVRARRQMEVSYNEGDWHAVKDWDQFISALLNQAFDDPDRNHNMLAKELEKILNLYGVMVKTLPDQAVTEWRVNP